MNPLHLHLSPAHRPPRATYHERQQAEADIWADAETLARLAGDRYGSAGMGLLARFCRRTGACLSLCYCPACGQSWKM